MAYIGPPRAQLVVQQGGVATAQPQGPTTQVLGLEQQTQQRLNCTSLHRLHCELREQITGQRTKLFRVG